MSIKSFEKFGFCIGLGFILLGGSSFEPKMSATNDRPFTVLSSASAQTSTCLLIYNQLAAESKDEGGTNGLVNYKTSLSAAWSKLKSASDVKASSDTTLISDGKSNFYKNYIQSSTETFQAKNVTIEGSISLSSGPDFVKGKKIRFANK